MPAVSKAQQRFMGMVHAADKGETPASPEVAKVSADMKDADAKDFASTKHDGLPDHVKEQIKSVVREVIREKSGMNEMSNNDVHFKHIMKMYDRGGSFTKKKIGAVVCKDPKASRKDVEEVLFDSDYRDIVEFEDELGLTEIREKYSSVNEEFKHVIHVDTPTQVVSKPIAAQIMALAKKGVRASEIGLEMGFVGNAKLATDTFQKVKNQIYFALDKRNESVNEAFSDKKVDAKIIADKMRKNSSTKSFADKVEKLGKVSAEDLDKMLPDFVAGSIIANLFKESVTEGLSKDAVVRTLTSDKNAYFLTKDGNGWILDITPKAAQQSTFHQKFDVKDLGKGHLGMKYKLSESLNEGLLDIIPYFKKKREAAAKKLADIHYTRKELAYNNVKAVYDTTIKALDNPKYSHDKDAKIKACNDLIWTIVSGAPKNEKVNWNKLKASYDWDELNEFGMMDEIESSFGEILKVKTNKNESVNEEHDCGCNENHDCGCGGVHEHIHIHEDLSADANGIAGLTASRATAVKDFLEKNNINSNKLYLSLKKGNLKDRMDFVTALVGNPGNPIQKKVIKQFSN